MFGYSGILVKVIYYKLTFYIDHNRARVCTIIRRLFFAFPASDSVGCGVLDSADATSSNSCRPTMSARESTRFCTVAPSRRFFLAPYS